MRTYRYRAMDPRGRLRRGALRAVDVEDLERRLHHVGLDLVNCRPARAGSKLGHRGRIGRRDLIEFCFHLAQLGQAGVTLLDALGEMKRSLENRRLAETVSAIHDRIDEGATLSEALAEHRPFDAVFVGLIRAGERSGELPAIFHGLTETLKWQDELVATAGKALVYPAFVTVVVLGVGGFMISYLVPELAGLLVGMEAELPLQTRLLLETSAFLREFWLFVLAAPLVAWLVLRLGKRRSDRFHLFHDRLLLKAPLLGEIFAKTVSARVARVFALMYDAGVPVLGIVEAAAETAGNRAIENALRFVRIRISEGRSLSRSFAAAGLFPPLVIRMIGIGEQTGALGDALLNVAYFHERDVRERVARLEAVLEPALTLVLGALLGWVMLAALGPVYDVITRIQP